MSVSLEGANQVLAGEFLDSDMGAFEVLGEHPVFAVALGKLADVLGWQGDVGGQGFECEFGDAVIGERESVGGLQMRMDADGVAVSGPEIAGEFDLAAIGLGTQIFRERDDGECLAEKIVGKRLGQGVVEGDGDPTRFVGDHMAGDVRHAEWIDVSDAVGLVLGETGGGALVWESFEDRKLPAFRRGQR